MIRSACVVVAVALAGGTLVAQPASSTRRVVRPAGTPADRPYSPGVAIGQVVYVSGQLGLPGSGPTPADITAQTRQAMDGVGSVLKAAGLGHEHLVKCHVYLRDMDDYAAMNAAYGSYFRDRVPARTTVQATALPGGAGLEIACVAHADLAGISVVRPPAGALPAPLGPYSPAVWAGDTLYVSGMGGQDPATRAVADGLGAQVDQTVANITTTLTAAGLGLADVVSAQAYGTRHDELPALQSALTRHFREDAAPPRGAVALPKLPGPIRAEITFVAARPTLARQRLGNEPYGLQAGPTLYLEPMAAADFGPTVEAQAEGVLATFRGALQDAGLTMRDVASVTVYLADIADLPKVNAAFAAAFPTEPPARTTVQVQLPGTERLRMSAVAAR